MENKNDLIKMLNSLVGNTITEIYYHDNFSGFCYFNQLSDCIKGIPHGSLFLKTSLGVFFAFDATEYDTDWFSIYGIGARNDIKPYEIPMQNKDAILHKYIDKPVIGYEIIDSITLQLGKLCFVPFCIKLSFQDGVVMYIANLQIEDFNLSNQTYEFIIGDEVVFFTTTDSINKHGVLNEKFLYSEVIHY